MEKNKGSFLHKKEWWEGLAANFFGALLGIAVTFGTSNYLENRDKKAMERTTVLMTISNLEISIQGLEQADRWLKSRDTLFKIVQEHYPDKLDQLSEDTVLMYVNSFHRRQFFTMDRSAEGVFTHSSDIWRTLDDHTLHQRIGHSFALRNALTDMVSNLFGMMNDAAEDFFAENYLYDRDDIAEVAKELTDRPKVRDFLVNYPRYVAIMDEELSLLKAMNKRNRQDMNITDDEFAEYLEVSMEEYEITDEVDSAE